MRFMDMLTKVSTLLGKPETSAAGGGDGHDSAVQAVHGSERPNHQVKTAAPYTRTTDVLEHDEERGGHPYREGHGNTGLIEVREESQPREGATGLELQISEYQNKIRKLESDTKRIETAYLKQREHLIRAYERHRQEQQQAELNINNLERELETSLRECQKLSTDNASLRTYIADTRDRQPVHTDTEYITAILQLNEMTKSWIATLSKAQKANDIEADMAEVRQALKMNRYGSRFASLIQNIPGLLCDILGNRRRRISLTRQLIWSELCDAIFQPFCFGLDSNVASFLSKAVDTVCTQEKNFANVLLIRQALGQGILSEVRPNQQKAKTRLEERLGTFLSALFPEAQSLQRKLQELVEESIHLANMMTEEKALFWCEMTPLGLEFDAEIMESFDDMANGRVTLCMFPAFGMTLREDGKNILHCLVKANVEVGEYVV